MPQPLTSDALRPGCLPNSPPGYRLHPNLSQLLGWPPRHTSPRSRQIPDPSRPQRGIAPASVAPRRFRCVRATRLFAACGGALPTPRPGLSQRPPASQLTHRACTPGLPSSSPPQGLYDETAQVFAVQVCKSVHSHSLSVPPRCISRGIRVHSWNPIARCPDEAQWPYRSRLPARTIPPFPSSMMPWPPCLGYCPIHAILPDSLLRLPPRILTGDETGDCRRALKRTSTTSTMMPRDRTQLRATLPSHLLRFYRFKGRPPPRTLAYTLASLTVLLP
ncbi:hypothetical protein B0H14DRAFT_3436430 [Mycena olivaceomarginata]|nr:hypothetical protein B0H14DRAFT_3436430 [Mycena olivaceomarginata]